MSAGEECIISEWLRSLGLQEYASAFYDNGYDELEVCKLIKDEDLDAIGVTNPLHRKIILDSVLILKCEGATSVYFTLEEVGRARARQQQSLQARETPTRELIYDVSSRPNVTAFHQPPQSTSPTQNTFTASNVTLPLPIEKLVRDKLERDQVDLRSPPFFQLGLPCAAKVTELAMRLSEELSQNYFQVLSVVESICLDPHRTLRPHQGEIRNTHSTEPHVSRDLSEMSLGSRQPPAVPTSPPPHNTHNTPRETGSNASFKSSTPSLHYHRSQSANFQYPMRIPSQAGMMAGWGGTLSSSNLEHTCGRIKGYQEPPCIIQRLPGCTCCPMQLSLTNQCTDMAVLEQRRREAMVQAKAGKMSANQALQQIRQCEKERGDMAEKKSKKKSATTKIGEFFKLPSFRKKSKPGNNSASGKPDRSLSCSDASAPPYPIGPSLSTSQLSNDLKAKCTCCLPPSLPASRSMNFSPCSCDECQKMRAGMVQAPPPPSPMLSHRSTPVRSSARYPSNRRVPADIVRAPPTCRQCNAPLNQPQKVLPKFYSPQVTRKTYQPLSSPTPHHYNKPVMDKLEAWYQQNLPSDDETRHLIDPNQSDDNSLNNTSFETFVQSSRGAVLSPPSSAPRTAFSAVKDTAGVNNLAHSYHSDSMSSDDLSTRQQRIKQQSGSEPSPTVTRGRRDSGCYLSNENLNNNSSNSSTCEKKDQGSDEGTTSSSAPLRAATTGENKVLDKVRQQMVLEGIDLTRAPYTDQKGHWCVPISLVSRYAKLCGTDLTTVALAMDTARCCDLRAREQPCVALSADTKGNPEQKRVSSVKEFLVLSGLPMYTEHLISNGCDTLPALASMTEDKLRLFGVTDPLHLEIIMSAINSTWHSDASSEQHGSSQAERV